MVANIASRSVPKVSYESPGVIRGLHTRIHSSGGPSVLIPSPRSTSVDLADKSGVIDMDFVGIDSDDGTS